MGSCVLYVDTAARISSAAIRRKNQSLTMNCPLYRTHSRLVPTIQAPSRHLQGRPPTRIHVAWCAHQHSPVTDVQARKDTAAAGLLKCAGNLAACQVPPELRDAV